MRAPLTRLLHPLLGAVVLTLGCGSSRTGAGPDASAGTTSAATLARVDADDRPPLALVGRSGDPDSALAFTASHARGGAMSAALSGLFAARLEAQGLAGVEARAHALGFELAGLADTADEADRFVRSVYAALSTPVRENEPALARARREAKAAHGLILAGPGDAAAAACSGELGSLPNTAELDLVTAQGLARLEAARSAVFRARAAAFAALGPPDFLDFAASALGRSDDWPTDPPDADTWPTSDVISADGNGTTRRLSVALRVAGADAAVAAGDTLGAAGSDLVLRLGAFVPPWSLERSTAIARPRGACLRFDVAPPRAEQGPTPTDIGRVSAVVEATARAALSRAEPGALDESLLRPTDPRRAAALAAWRALEGREEPGADRITVAYVSDPSDRVVPSELTRSVTLSRARLGKRTFEVGSRIESGQGELWMLLATPCGTALESAADAGALSLALRAMSETATGSIWLEPWVTSDGVGLLAHGPRLDPRESAALHARRIARALGRALGERLAGPRIAVARDALTAELGGQAFPGWASTLEGLSPNRPSLLEPRGTWASLASLTNDSLERARRLLVQAPLKLTLLANVSETQSDVAASEIEEWLLPSRSELRACSPLAQAAARRGAIELGISEADAREGAYVGVVLAEESPRAARVLELTAFLLNRPGGFLEQSFASPKLAATARAHALGGARRPALVVDIRALPQDLPEGIARVRSVLERMAVGGVTPAEFKFAEAELDRKDALARLDPRRRIVELWRNTRVPEIDLAVLRSIHASLRGPSHWIVQVKPGS